MMELAAAQKDKIPCSFCLLIHLHHYLSLNREGRWGTTDDLATSFLHFSLFSAALWDLANSRLVHSLMLSSHLFFCLPFFFPLSLCLAGWFWPDLMDGRHDYTIAVCISLRWSVGLRVVRLLQRRRIQAMEMRCYRKILRISYKDHVYWLYVYIIHFFK